MDPNSLSLDPDLEFWSNLEFWILFRIQGYVINFYKKKLKIILEKNTFLKRQSFVETTYKEIISPEELFSQLIGLIL